MRTYIIRTGICILLFILLVSLSIMIATSKNYSSVRYEIRNNNHSYFVDDYEIDEDGRLIFTFESKLYIIRDYYTIIDRNKEKK